MSEAIVDDIVQTVLRRNPGEAEFHQAVREVLGSIVPVLERYPEFIRSGVVARLVEPERQILFRVPWMDDRGEVRVNRGFRVQFNGAIGPYKGGTRFHPSVYLGIIKFLAFEQVLKNALTTASIGGAKGGSDFDPKGKSDNEVMRFCQSYMTEVFRHIGPDTDVPAGDIGVSEREIGYLFGQYRRLTNTFTGALTGKEPGWGGSPGRSEATGHGLVYFMTRIIEDRGRFWKGLRVVISGSGNVALHAAEKLLELGARVVAMSDSNGHVVEEGGVRLPTLVRIKEVQRGRIKEYAAEHATAEYHQGPHGIWSVPCDVALPCATENELDGEGAAQLVRNGCVAVGEGANMPTTPQAMEVFRDNDVAFGPAKAANAGGVAVSAMEMAQNSARQPWSYQEVDRRLQQTMNAIYDQCAQAAEAYGVKGDLVAGANIAGFLKVGRAMLDQGLV